MVKIAHDLPKDYYTIVIPKYNSHLFLQATGATSCTSYLWYLSFGSSKPEGSGHQWCWQVWPLRLFLLTDLLPVRPLEAFSHSEKGSSLQSDPYDPTLYTNGTSWIWTFVPLRRAYRYHPVQGDQNCCLGASHIKTTPIVQKQVKPGFTTYQPKIKYFCALSKIEEKATKNNKTNII